MFVCLCVHLSMHLLPAAWINHPEIVWGCLKAYWPGLGRMQLGLGHRATKYTSYSCYHKFVSEVVIKRTFQGDVVFINRKGSSKVTNY